MISDIRELSKLEIVVIGEAIMKAGLSQNKTASELGIPPSTFCEWRKWKSKWVKEKSSKIFPL